MNNEQKSFLSKKNNILIKQNPLYRKLRKRLLSVGGDEVCLRVDPDLDKIVKDGVIWPQERRRARGEPHRCHGNAARLWLKDKRGKVSIITGYALMGNVWIQHSWAFDGKVVETIGIFDCYFGVQIKDVFDSLRFAISNLPTEEVNKLLEANDRIGTSLIERGVKQ